MTEPVIARVVAAATGIATSRRHAFVGTEHLFAGLLEDSSGFAATLLGKAGLDPAQVSTTILEGLRTSSGDEGSAPALTRFGERAIEAARRLAGERQSEVEDRDLMAVLIGQPKGRMAQALRGDGKALEALQAALGTGRTDPPTKAPKGTAERPADARPRQGSPDPRAAREKREGREPREPRGPRVSREPGEAREPRPARSVAEPVKELPPRRIARPDPPKPFPWIMLLLAAIPASIVLAMMDGPPVAIFVTACLGVLPLASIMGQATESLADRTGPTVGGLLNATFGNAAELIIALAALRAGLVDLVKASVTGSILGNLLLILGLSFVAGGGRTDLVRFSRTNAGMSAAMMALAVVGLVFPTLFHALHPIPDQAAELRMSEIVAGILIVTYGLSLLFSLKTHRALFGGGHHPEATPRWGVGLSVGILAAATIGVVIESEILVHVVSDVTASVGVSQTFLGLIIIPLIGNAAEHATAILVARKGQMDLALQIALGSSTQIALLVAPVLVFAGLAIGAQMNLVFPVFDVAALAVATIVISIITLDGETHWFEGAQLLALYAMLAAAALFI
ncbi:MAG: calcium/proton exchanger [Gemmatimonadales bacterium]